MLRETETKETMSFVVIILIIGGTSIGGGRQGPGPPWLHLRACVLHQPNLFQRLCLVGQIGFAYALAGIVST